MRRTCEEAGPQLEEGHLSGLFSAVSALRPQQQHGVFFMPRHDQARAMKQTNPTMPMKEDATDGQ